MDHYRWDLGATSSAREVWRQKHPQNSMLTWKVQGSFDKLYMKGQVFPVIAAWVTMPLKANMAKRPFSSGTNGRLGRTDIKQICFVKILLDFDAVYKYGRFINLATSQASQLGKSCNMAPPGTACNLRTIPQPKKEDGKLMKIDEQVSEKQNIWTYLKCSSPSIQLF